jgi:hypothetical protein
MMNKLFFVHFLLFFAAYSCSYFSKSFSRLRII